jgi:hypothetical protein
MSVWRARVVPNDFQIPLEQNALETKDVGKSYTEHEWLVYGNSCITICEHKEVDKRKRDKCWISAAFEIEAEHMVGRGNHPLHNYKI